MGIISKIEVPQDTNQLGGKPVRVTRFKSGEVLIYNSVRKQWEAGAMTSMRGVAIWVSPTDPSLTEDVQPNDLWIQI